jgi:sec-independent protein translocase protein TatB
MFNVGGGELIVIMLLALVVLGPQRLPSAARQMGKALGELRRLSSGFQNEVRSAVREAESSDRAAAQRNVLAKESQGVDGPTEAEPARRDGERSPSPTPGADRPARRAPLKAAASATAAGRKGANGAPVKAARTGVTGRAAAKKTTAKKDAASKSVAKKAPSKAAAKRTSS